MPRPRLLLLLPSTTYRTAAFVEAARRLDVELTVASDHSNVFGAEQPAGLLALDFAKPERAVEEVRAFAMAHPLAAVVGVDDDTAIVAAAVAEALELPHNPFEAALAARDKHRQRVRLAEAGVPVPPFALRRLDEEPDRLARRASYPCVLKPLRLSASRGVIRADTPGEFVAALGRLRRILAAPDAAACGEPARWFLVESFVPGPEVALEGLLEEGRLHLLALFDKPDPLDGPFFEETIYVTPSRLPNQAQAALGECAARAACALGLRGGPIHAELRYNDAGPWLIELAARPIGGRCSQALRFGEGEGRASLEELILRHALGLPIATCERERVAASVMMIPTPRPGVLRAVTGVEAARAVEGIDEVLITAMGQELVPLPEGSRYLGFLFARAPSPAGAEEALREAHAKLGFDIVPPPVDAAPLAHRA
ncbi:MAG: ATP-grasp domain-containing protein [Gemmatimonadetes bacterium]|nr:ATP-grasp domain-containing protein [Gemmatimonadota bacterium]